MVERLFIIIVIRVTVMCLSTKFILTRIFISVYKDKATLANGVVSLDRTSLLFHITLVEQAKYKSLSLQVR